MCRSSTSFYALLACAFSVTCSWMKCCCSVYHLIDEKNENEWKIRQNADCAASNTITRVVCEAAFKEIRKNSQLTSSELRKKSYVGKWNRKRKPSFRFFPLYYISRLPCFFFILSCASLHHPHTTSQSQLLHNFSYTKRRRKIESGWLAGSLDWWKMSGCLGRTKKRVVGLAGLCFLWKEKVYVVIKTSSESLDAEKWNGRESKFEKYRKAALSTKFKFPRRRVYYNHQFPMLSCESKFPPRIQIGPMR